MAEYTRRRLLAVAGTTTLAGCLQSSIRRAADDAGTETPTAEPPVRASPRVVVEVGAADGDLGFAPGTERTLRIRPGTTVVFVWRSDTHNIAVASQPPGADWRGTPGDVGTTYDAGYRHEHTFTVPGRYEYYCVPHETLFPHAAIEVGQA